MEVPVHYTLNFEALGTFSPLNILSAPTFFPLLGHPDFCPNKLCIMLQEMAPMERNTRSIRNDMVLRVFIGYSIKRIKPTNIILHLQATPPFYLGLIDGRKPQYRFCDRLRTAPGRLDQGTSVLQLADFE
jgi:hypothetical protein